MPLVRPPKYILAYRLLLNYLVRSLRFTKRQKRPISQSVDERELIEMHRKMK